LGYANLLPKSTLPFSEGTIWNSYSKPFVP
jgi:hypothetical protein